MSQQVFLMSVNFIIYIKYISASKKYFLHCKCDKLLDHNSNQSVHMNSTMYSCDKARKIFLLLYMYFFIEYFATKFSFFFF